MVMSYNRRKSSRLLRAGAPGAGDVGSSPTMTVWVNGTHKIHRSRITLNTCHLNHTRENMMLFKRGNRYLIESHAEYPISRWGELYRVHV